MSLVLTKDKGCMNRKRTSRHIFRQIISDCSGGRTVVFRMKSLFNFKGCKIKNNSLVLISEEDVIVIFSSEKKKVKPCFNLGFNKGKSHVYQGLLLILK